MHILLSIFCNSSIQQCSILELVAVAVAIGVKKSELKECFSIRNLSMLPCPFYDIRSYFH